MVERITREALEVLRLLSTGIVPDPIKGRVIGELVREDLVGDSLDGLTATAEGRRYLDAHDRERRGDEAAQGERRVP